MAYPRGLGAWTGMLLSRRLGLASLGLAACLLAGGVGLSLVADRTATERQVLREMGVLADTMAAQASALLGGLDRALLSLAALADDQTPPDALAAALSTRESTLPEGIILALLRPDGSTPEIATAAGLRRLAGLEQGMLAQALAEPAGQIIRQPVLGPPIRSVNGPLLPLFYRLPDSRVALALLPLRLLEGFYARLELTPGSTVALLDQDTRLLTRIPPGPPDALGQSLGPRAQATSTGPQPHQGWNGSVLSPVDHEARLAALRPVPGYPVSVVVSLRRDGALEQWRHRAWLGGLLTTVAIGAAGLGLLLVSREARQRLRAQAAATARLERLARGSAGIVAVAELPALLGHIGRLTREALSAPYACLTLHDGDRQEESGIQQAVSLDPEAELPGPLLRALDAWASHRGRAADAAPRLWPPGPHGLPARASIGLRDEQGQPLGALVVVAPEGRGFSADDEAMLAQLARLAEIAIRNRGLIAAAHRAAEEARNARQGVERLLEAVSDGFVAMDASWCVTYANAAALRLAQRQRKEVVGHSIWELYPALAGLESFDQLQAVASRGQAREFEQYLEDAQRWFEAYAFPAADGVAVFFREVTDARRTQHRMQQSQRMEAMGRLTGSVAHDFNNLLAIISGNAEMLEEELAHDPSGMQSVGLIRDAAERGRTLVRHLLAFAGQQPDLTPQEVAPEQLLDRLLPLLRRVLGSRVRLEISAPRATLPRLRLVAEQAENAVLNLAINARDAMPDGGTLTLEMEAVELDAEALRDAPDTTPGRYLRLMVSDTGTGMTREVLEHATEPFFSTKGSDHGLGLASVHSFARQNGGLLRLESWPGHGTRATLLLPEARAPEPAAAIVHLPPPPGGDEQVLLVEDEAALRQTIERQVAALGYRVTAVEGGPEALAALEAGLRPDLLLTDVILPGGLSGPRLAARMRERMPALRVLLISGYTLRDQEDHSGEMDFLLPKPLDGLALARHLRRLLDSPPLPFKLQDVENHTRGLV